MRRSHRPFLLPLALVFVVSSFTSYFGALPWYAEGHRIVATQAINLLPPDIREFFSYYHSVINASANYPDFTWPSSDPSEGLKHYIDLEIARPNFENREAGVLPFAINQTYFQMVESWRAGDFGMALVYAGALSHYVADSGQPYHTTVNYNPKGKHGLADSLLEDHISELELVQAADLPAVQDVFSEALQVIYESHDCLTLLNATLIGDPDDPADDREWSPELRDMVEERANRVIVFTARLWASAIQAAGVPVPSLPSVNSLSMTVSAPSEVLDNRTVAIRITVLDSLGIPTPASVSAKLGTTDLLVTGASDPNPIGKFQAIIPVAVLEQNSGRQMELSVSASFRDYSPASWKGSIAIESSKPQPDITDVALPAVAAVVIVAIAAGVLVMRRRKGT